MAVRRKKDLSAVLAKAKEGQEATMPPRVTTPAATPAIPAKEPKAETPQAEDGQGRGRGTSRDGKKAVITYLAPDIHVRLKILAATQGTTIQDLSEEAYRLLFAKYEG